MAWRKKLDGKGRPPKYITWLAVWMDFKRFTVEDFARMLLTAPSSVMNWRRGRPMSIKSARLMLAFFPDAPVHAYGGPTTLATDPLPLRSRTAKFYRFLFERAGILERRCWPQAIAEARARYTQAPVIRSGEHYRAAPPSEPGESPVTPGEPNP